jgi:hypothetical protein
MTAALATLYLVLLPQRPMGLDAVSALAALGLVAATARDTRERVWGSASAPHRDRLRRATVSALALTVSGLVLLAAWATGRARLAGAEADVVRK